MKKNSLSLLLLATILLLVSCRHEVSPPATEMIPRKMSVSDPTLYNSMNLGMAFTEPWELSTIYEANPENVIDYRVARYLAAVELIAGVNKCVTGEMFNCWTLTPYPKVVYNYDNSPKYYEFGYVENGEIQAVITTYAQKEIDGAIAYIVWGTPSQKYADMDYYVGKSYPAHYYGNGCPELYYDAGDECIKSIDFDLPEIGTDEFFREQMLAEMDNEDIANMQSDLDEYGDTEFEEFLQERDEFWQTVDDFFQCNQDALNVWEDGETIFATDCIYDYINEVHQPEENPWAKYVSQLSDALDYTKGFYNAYTLPDYTDQRLQVTYWDTYCGPAACAWVYRGKYSEYKGFYLPLFGDVPTKHFIYNTDGLYAYYDINNLEVAGLSAEESREVYMNRSYETDNGLTACFYEECKPFWWKGEWTFPLFHCGLNRCFSKVTHDTYKVTFTCSPYKWIMEKGEPVLIAVNCDHYLVAFGTGVTLKNNGKIRHKYYMIADNGYTTSEHKNQPYMRKHNGWNLHYGLTRKH